MLAAKYNNLKVAQKLIDLGAFIKKFLGEPPFYQAIIRDDSRTIANLIKLGWYFDVKYKGETPLEFALYYDRRKVAKQLVEHGANINVGGCYIDRVFYYNNYLLLELLIKRGLNLGDEALFCSVTDYRHREQCTSVLIKYGAKVNVRDDEGHTPLILAAMCGHTKIVSILLENGAEVNIKDYDGKTTLDYAREKNYKDIVAALIKYGALR